MFHVSHSEMGLVTGTRETLLTPDKTALATSHSGSLWLDCVRLRQICSEEGALAGRWPKS
jgi:hypothetical protein